MVKYIIFDLSEVLIAGLLGIESILADELDLPVNRIIDAFGGDNLHKLLVGEISEDEYLASILTAEKWNLTPDKLKKIIRNNFHNKLEGSIQLVEQLKGQYQLILLSDHAREWVSYILEIHPFIKNSFSHIIFSYELSSTKKDPVTFQKTLTLLNVPAPECIFIDDHPLNVKNAEAMGIKGIHFQDPHLLRTELSKFNLL